METPVFLTHSNEKAFQAIWEKEVRDRLEPSHCMLFAQ